MYYKTLLHYCKLFIKNYFIKEHFPFKINTVKQSAFNIQWILACKCIVCSCLSCRTNEAKTSKSTIYFTLLYPPNMHYPAQCVWDVHMPIYLHLSSARFLLHTMIMMMQTMSTITIAPTTIAIIMMRCSLSSFPHQLISTARQNNNLLPAILWEYIRKTLLICWKGKWYMQLHSHFNYITLYEL